MSVKILTPSPSDRFAVGSPVQFSGVAECVSVRLVADGNITLGSVGVANGRWVYSRAFSQAGTRTIEVFGSDGSKASMVVTISPCDCDPRFVTQMQNGVKVYRQDNAVLFRAGMTIDADGAYKAYHKKSSLGLDDLSNAGHEGDWWGIVTASGDSSGKPVIQTEDDPAPGFYVSSTTLVDDRFQRTNPLRYVDSESIPFFVISGRSDVRNLFTIGDYGVVYNRRNGKWCFAIYADIGPKSRLGEGSIALAKALGINSSARIGGMDERNCVYCVFPHSRQSPYRKEEFSEGVFEKVTSPLFDAWGGIERLKLCGGKLG